MEIAIIDADLIAGKTNRFPNLACMKIAAYFKAVKDYTVTLKTDYNNLKDYYGVYISKVFTDTPVPKEILDMPTVYYGGTGFLYNKAPFLSELIEHMQPDYSLYDDWVQAQLNRGVKPVSLKYYKEYSIGFTTRFCFRKCKFCVNQDHKEVRLWSPLEEFVSPDKRKICLLDDNVLGYRQSSKILEQLGNLNKPYQYKQGLDIRLLNKENASLLYQSRYDGDFLFAFDSLKDKKIIEDKLSIWRELTQKGTRFYILCAFDENGKYDLEFWEQDIISVFERIKILIKYDCLPYIMRYENYKQSPFYKMYVNLANWCNQPQYFKKLSFREWHMYEHTRKDGHTSVMEHLRAFESNHQEIANKYFDLAFENKE